MYFAPRESAHFTHWSVSSSLGSMAESGVERSSDSRSCQVLGAKCMKTPISMSCQASWSAEGNASLACSATRGSENANDRERCADVRAPVKDARKLRLFISIRTILYWSKFLSLYADRCSDSRNVHAGRHPAFYR